MNLVLSPKAATRLAVVLAAAMAAIVLFGALRPIPERARLTPVPDTQIGCALVLTTNGQECR